MFPCTDRLSRFARGAVVRPSRTAVANLIESIDFMDPTRSHEALPSRRMAEGKASQRHVAAAVSFVLIVLAFLVLAAI